MALNTRSPVANALLAWSEEKPAGLDVRYPNGKVLIEVPPFVRLPTTKITTNSLQPRTLNHCLSGLAICLNCDICWFLTRETSSVVSTGICSCTATVPHPSYKMLYLRNGSAATSMPAQLVGRTFAIPAVMSRRSSKVPLSVGSAVVRNSGVHTWWLVRENSSLREAISCVIRASLSLTEEDIQLGHFKGNGTLRNGSGSLVKVLDGSEESRSIPSTE